ncbi:hypothetical protein [Fodinicola feengrottensis]|uniref:hypothetical protein n=1 Tax=Fodinicola feengrottensis TaxID=435914 RepID=UPI0024413B3A|nr:hypothetical protein [Fodinicola feengrottensis]
MLAHEQHVLTIHSGVPAQATSTAGTAFDLHPDNPAKLWQTDAQQYGVPDTDALLLALNLYGLCTPLGPRVRLQLSLIACPDVRTVVVAAGGGRIRRSR